MNHENLVEKQAKECVIPIKNKTTEEIIKEITKEITKAVSSYREYEKIPLTIKIDGKEFIRIRRISNGQI